MSAKILKTNQMIASGISEYAVDTLDEVDMLPTSTTPATGDLEEEFRNAPLPLIGSTCLVGNNGDLRVFMLFSDGWMEI